MKGIIFRSQKCSIHMKGKKIKSVISSLSSSEMLSLRDFVQSPYFNKNPHLMALVDYLSDKYPDFGDQVFEPQSLAKSPYFDQPITAKKLSYYLSDFQKLLDQFLVVERLQQKEYLREYMCINALRERNLRDQFMTRILRFQDRLDELGHFHREALTVRFMVSDVIAELSTYQNKETEASLQKAIDNLFELFLTNVLRYASESRNRMSVQYPNPPRIPLLEELEDLFQEYRQRSPVINLHYLLYACVQNPEEDEYFDELRKHLSIHQQAMGADQLRNFYLSTINISLRKMRSKPNKYTQATLDIYTEGIDNRALMEGNYLSPWTFTNTIKLALRAHRIQWAERFMHNYQKLLSKDQRNNVLGLTKGELAFAQGEYHEALAHLNNVSTTAIRYHILVSILRIKSLWELEEINPAIAALSAFKVYLSRTRGIALPWKKGAQSFCQLLHRISVGGTERKRLETRDLINNTALLIDKAWLMKVFAQENPKL